MEEWPDAAAKPAADAGVRRAMLIPGVILAGGESRRMGGGDKTLLPLAGQPMLGHVIDRFLPQVATLALNANGDAARFARFDLPVLTDPVAGRPGPLAGVLAAMDWAAGQGAQVVVTVAGDTPFLPGDLVPRLLLASEGMRAPLAIAATRSGLHPVFGLWSVTLRDDLAQAIPGGTRRVRDWTEAQGARQALFPDDYGDPFFNINTPEDLRQAEGLLEARS